MSSNRLDVGSETGTHTALAASPERVRRTWPRVSCLVALAALGILWPPACVPVDPEDAGETEDVALATGALSGCAWDPGFGSEYCYQGSWWIEFSVEDATIAALALEVDDAPTPRVVDLPSRMSLPGDHVKFSGGPGSGPVESGTLVRLLAARSAVAGGQTAASGWFAYLQGAPAVECASCTPSCAAGTCGSDGCGGTCACASGAVCMPDETCCQPNSAPCGPDGCGGTHGACQCVPSCLARQCGDDGCGGTCGTCVAGTTCSGSTCVGACAPVWSPRWRQIPYSGPWWYELEVSGGGSLARSVSLQVLGGATYPLTLGYGPWATGLPGIPSGTQVLLKATDATGATAQTVPFPFLVDTAPLTDPCAGTPSALPACQPLPRGMVTFAMDDSHESQASLAASALAQRGFKATIYHITDVLSSYGLLPSAQALAAAGHEVADHSRSHPYLPGLTPAELDDELRLSRQYLTTHVGSPVDSFASPMGAYDPAILAAAKLHFSSHRTVNPGVNFMGSDVYQLKADGVYNTSPVASVCADLQETALLRGWRILVFHDFTSEPTSTYSLTYPIADFDDILACAESTPGLDVVTTRQGAALLACASPE